MDRIKYIENVDTLSKSQKEVEDDRHQREMQSSHMESRIILKLNQRMQPNISDGKSQSLQEEDNKISIEKFLTYNNPIMKSEMVGNFITGALCTARFSSVMPSSSVCHKWFEGDTDIIFPNKSKLSELHS